MYVQVLYNGLYTQYLEKAMQSSQPSERLDIRISPDAKKMILAAAAARNQSLSEFVLGCAMEKADAVLSERQVFSLSAEAWEEFQAALDAPPRKHPRMERLFQEPNIFD